MKHYPQAWGKCFETECAVGLVIHRFPAIQWDDLSYEPFVQWKKLAYECHAARTVGESPEYGGFINAGASVDLMGRKAGSKAVGGERDGRTEGEVKLAHHASSPVTS
jgi:hypothetical protein